MTGEPVEFLGDVETLQLQHQFLFDAVAIDGSQQLRDAFQQTRAHARLDLRQTRAHLHDQRAQRGAALFDELTEALAFAQAHRAQFVERLLEQRAASA